MKLTKATGCYCGVGCGVSIESESGRITGVQGDPDHPANFGRSTRATISKNGARR